MKTTAVPRDWLLEDGYRLSAAPYHSPAREARRRLSEVETTGLQKVTVNGPAGIFNGPRFARQYVDSPNHGVPLLSGADVLSTDFGRLPLLSRKQVGEMPYMILHEGMTVITSYGTVGRVAYVRSDMVGSVGSDNVMKIDPDERTIFPGYLFAFLSSRFGIPLTIVGVTGGTVQFLPPSRMYDLPVPRFDRSIERRAHDLVESASSKRTEALILLAEARKQFAATLPIGVIGLEVEHSESVNTIADSGLLQSRMDAFYYSRINREARSAFDHANTELVPLSEVAEVFIPGIFKRRYADDPQHGYPYITGADVFQLAPTSEKYLMTSVAVQYQLVLKKGMILIQEAGQLGGLIGRSVQVGEYLDGFACTNNMVRVTPYDEADAGYLYSVLSSPYGIRLISREAAGSSIPHIEVSRVQNLMISWADEVTRRRIGEPAIQARKLRDEACADENAARELVERAIEKAAA